MPTKPIHDIQSIIMDAERVLACAEQDQSDKAFASRAGHRELVQFANQIATLKESAGDTTLALHAQVEAGEHAASIRAPIAILLRDVRDDAKLAFAGKDALLRAFGVGASFNAASTSSIEAAGHALLRAQQEHPAEAAKIHFDTKTVHHLEDMLHALERADIAHVAAMNERHGRTTAIESLANAVAAKTAHIRLAAKRAFRADAARLDRYASTLPRHAVKHRSKHAQDPAPAVS